MYQQWNQTAYWLCHTHFYNHVDSNLSIAVVIWPNLCDAANRLVLLAGNVLVRYYTAALKEIKLFREKKFQMQLETP